MSAPNPDPAGLAALPANTWANPYRGLSVQDCPVPLEHTAITAWLLGREAYRRTEFLALRGATDEVALVRVRTESQAPLFSPITAVEVLAEPGAAVWLDRPEVDVGSASALAACAVSSGLLAEAYVVRGRYEHVNFLWHPAPVTIHVTEVVPPLPPKLAGMAAQARDFDENLPPIVLVEDLVDIADLVAQHPAPVHLLPCKGAAGDYAGPVAYLDTRPADRQDWVMVGCERSLQFHEHFYGDTPERVDLCPLRRTFPEGELVLAKCCLLERGVERVGDVAVVPWGSTLDEVRTALRSLCGLPPLEEPAPISALPPEWTSAATPQG